MWRRNLYYTLKPFVPQRLRFAARRAFARGLRERLAHVWPIDETAGEAPVGWPGWPGGRQFAFVLTHDVESQAGLDRVRHLAEIEMDLGFRSSFNFIPEGPYKVPPDLLRWLVGHGFEIGVHDLNHDGKLYRSRDEFAAKAKRINHHVKEWGAVGFRSGFMHHNLEWLGDLEVLYDASTFDTDPFEPQPDGVGTIFPFWVDIDRQAAEPGGRDGAQPARTGYVELPYTLPQDSTLFLLFREKTIGIWQRKLDWIAAKGGMALLNTHPDYMDFDGSGSDTSWSAGLYREFLDGVASRYDGAFWHTHPAAVATYFLQSYPTAARPVKRRHACMVTYSHYESDNRVMRYATALRQTGYNVDVVALNNENRYPRHEVLDGVRVHRIQNRVRNERGPFSYLARVLRFFAGASRELSRMQRVRAYDVVHVHNVPDFLVFTARAAKKNGAAIVLDLHDILPEFFASKFGAGERSLLVRLLKLVERISARYADHVIISNHLWLEKIVARSAPRAKCSAFINYVDMRAFQRSLRTRSDARPIVLYPGGLQWHQGLDIAIRAFAHILPEFPDAEFHIYGDGPAKDALVALVEELQLQGRVHFFPMRPHREVAQLMANADLGVVAKRADSFGNEAYSTKIMEFMSQGVPVVASETRIDRYYFDDETVYFFESGNVAKLAAALRELLGNPDRRSQLSARGLEYAGRNNWSTRRSDYLQLVERLIAEKHGEAPAASPSPVQREAVASAITVQPLATSSSAETVVHSR